MMTFALCQHVPDSPLAWSERVVLRGLFSREARPVAALPLAHHAEAKASRKACSSHLCALRKRIGRLFGSLLRPSYLRRSDVWAALCVPPIEGRSHVQGGGESAGGGFV